MSFCLGKDAVSWGAGSTGEAVGAMGVAAFVGVRVSFEEVFLFVSLSCERVLPVF